MSVCVLMYCTAFYSICYNSEGGGASFTCFLWQAQKYLCSRYFLYLPSACERQLSICVLAGFKQVVG